MPAPSHLSSPPLLWFRFSTALIALSGFFVLAPYAHAQCASGLFPNWRLCGSGTTITEGTQASISLWIARGTGVDGQAAKFSITVSSSIAGGDPLNTSTGTIGSTAITITTATFNVFAPNDSVYTGRRNFSISASRIDPNPPEASSSVATFSGVITDDESPPSITLTASPTSWSESASSVSVSFTATLGEAIGKSLSVTFSASGTSDYSVSSSQTRTISTGSTTASASLTFTPVDDDVDEPNISITARAASNDSGIGSATVTLTQRDNDTSEALSFTKTAVSVPEGGTASYSVSLATRPTGTVTVAVSRSSGDSDLTVMPASLTFTTTNWSQGQQVTVSAAEDLDLADGQATISHSASGGGYSSISGNVTATEDDDDTAALSFTRTSLSVSEGASATYKVSLAYEPSASVTVTVSRSSGDTDLTVNKSSLTFTTSNWNTGQEVTVSAAEDLDGLNGQATIRHTASGGDYGSVTGDVTVTESDNDSPGLSFTKTSLTVAEGGTATYKVSLAYQPVSTVAVVITRASGDPDLSVEPASLTFITTNWNTAQQVTVSGAEDDDLADGSATIRHSALGGGYDSVAADVTTTEDDNDSGGMVFSSSSVTVPEGGSRVYTIRLAHKPIASVTVAVSKSSGDSDLTVSPASLTFMTTNWNTGQEVTVSAADDTDTTNGTATIAHSASGGGYMAVTGDVNVTESDNDAPGLTLSDTSPSVREGHMTIYTLSLAAQPSTTVTVTLTTTGDPDLSVSPTSLTFTTTNWNQTQDITVSAREDEDLVDGTATLTHSASGGGYDSITVDTTAMEIDNDTATSPDPAYNGIGIDDLEVIVGDDDQIVSSAILSLDDQEIAEGEASAIVTVTATLDAVTTSEITISLSLGGTASAQDYDVGGEHTITIDAGEDRGQTVLTFVPLDDALVEGTETIIINGSAPDLVITQTTLNLLDDDTAVGEAVGTLSVDLDRIAESARDTLVTVTLTLEDDFTFDELRTFEVAVRGTGQDNAVDFAPVAPITLTLLTNVSTAQSTFVLRPENDLVDEVDETLTLAVVESPLPVNSTQITLVDDDAPPTGISLSLDDPDIVEGEPSTDITLTARVEGGTTYARPTTVSLSLGGTALREPGQITPFPAPWPSLYLPARAWPLPS